MLRIRADCNFGCPEDYILRERGRSQFSDALFRSGIGCVSSEFSLKECVISLRKGTLSLHSLSIVIIVYSIPSRQQCQLHFDISLPPANGFICDYHRSKARGHENSFRTSIVYKRIREGRIRLQNMAIQ